MMIKNILRMMKNETNKEQENEPEAINIVMMGEKAMVKVPKQCAKNDLDLIVRVHRQGSGGSRGADCVMAITQEVEDKK